MITLQDIYGARKFVPRSYEESDALAKEIFIKYITKKGHTIINDKEDYNHDVVTEEDGITHYFELEIKRNYPFNGRKSFPFKSVSFLGRKKRLHDIQPFTYVIICDETCWAVCCDSQTIFNDSYTVQKNIDTYQRSGMDEMYHVPIDICKFFKIR